MKNLNARKLALALAALAVGFVIYSLTSFESNAKANGSLLQNRAEMLQQAQNAAR